MSFLNSLVALFSLISRDNLVEIDVYFEEMSTQVIQQVPAYDEESLFGELLIRYHTKIRYLS